MIWNEPNNMSHWDFDIDPGWTSFAGMAKLAGDAIRAESDLPRPNAASSSLTSARG